MSTVSNFLRFPAAGDYILVLVGIALMFPRYFSPLRWAFRSMDLASNDIAHDISSNKVSNRYRGSNRYEIRTSNVRKTERLPRFRNATSGSRCRAENIGGHRTKCFLGGSLSRIVFARQSCCRYVFWCYMDLPAIEGFFLSCPALPNFDTEWFETWRYKSY